LEGGASGRPKEGKFNEFGGSTRGCLNFSGRRGQKGSSRGEKNLNAKEWGFAREKDKTV